MEEYSWDDVVSEFRALGGRIENVCRKPGRHGFGMHVLDSGKPWELFVPENLLIPAKDVVIEDGALKLGPLSAVGARERQFFEQYEANLSWGPSGRADAENYFVMMRELPGHAREFLVKHYRVEQSVFEPPSEGQIVQQFLQSRLIRYRGDRVVMPMVDLVNYGPEGAYRFDNGISVGGNFSAEILVDYGGMDPTQVFASWGFAAASASAFSIPVVCRSGDKQIRVLNRLDPVKREDGNLEPGVEVRGRQVTATHVLLGNRKTPAQPRKLFQTAMHKLGVEEPDALFNEIIRHNRRAFLNLLGHIENEAGGGAAVLRTVVRHQLSALSEEMG